MGRIRANSLASGSWLQRDKAPRCNWRDTRCAARQAKGRGVAVARAGMTVISRGLAATMPTYPVEAAVALSNSVQADELDDRCGTASTCLADGATVRTLAASLGRPRLPEGGHARGRG